MWCGTWSRLRCHAVGRSAGNRCCEAYGTATPLSEIGPERPEAEELVVGQCREAVLRCAELCSLGTASGWDARNPRRCRPYAGTEPEPGTQQDCAGRCATGTSDAPWVTIGERDRACPVSQAAPAPAACGGRYLPNSIHFKVPLNIHGKYGMKCQVARQSGADTHACVSRGQAGTTWQSRRHELRWVHA